MFGQSEVFDTVFCFNGEWWIKEAVCFPNPSLVASCFQSFYLWSHFIRSFFVFVWLFTIFSYILQSLDFKTSSDLLFWFVRRQSRYRSKTCLLQLQRRQLFSQLNLMQAIRGDHVLILRLFKVFIFFKFCHYQWYHHLGRIFLFSRCLQIQVISLCPEGLVGPNVPFLLAGVLQDEPRVSQGNR